MEEELNAYKVKLFLTWLFKQIESGNKEVNFWWKVWSYVHIFWNWNNIFQYQPYWGFLLWASTTHHLLQPNQSCLDNQLLQHHETSFLCTTLNDTPNASPQHNNIEHAAAAQLSLPEMATIHRAKMIQSKSTTYLPDNLLLQEILTIDATFNIHKPVITEPIALTRIHPTLGLKTKDDDKIKNNVCFTGCVPSTISHKMLSYW